MNINLGDRDSSLVLTLLILLLSESTDEILVMALLYILT